MTDWVILIAIFVAPIIAIVLTKMDNYDAD